MSVGRKILFQLWIRGKKEVVDGSEVFEHVRKLAICSPTNSPAYYNPSRDIVPGYIL